MTRLDVTDPESVRSAVAETSERFGAIDVLVNRAAHGAYGPLGATSMDSHPDLLRDDPDQGHRGADTRAATADPTRSCGGAAEDVWKTRRPPAGPGARLP